MIASISALTQIWHDQKRFTTAHVPQSLPEHVTRWHLKQSRRVVALNGSRQRMQYRISDVSKKSTSPNSEHVTASGVSTLRGTPREFH